MNICLDTETTGLNPSFDEILQLSIIDSNTNEVLLMTTLNHSTLFAGMKHKQ